MQKTFFSFLFLIFASVFAVYWFHVKIDPKTEEQFERLCQESHALHTRKTLQETPAKQKRQNVQKEIWSQNEASHFLIQSKESKLTFSQKKDSGSLQAIEELKEIYGITQDGIALHAKEGIYSYPSHHLIAKKQCLLTQGSHQIEGTQIDFDFVKEIVCYENPKGLLGSFPLHFSAKKMLWDKKNEKLYLLEDVKLNRADQFHLTAQSGTIELKKSSPSSNSLNLEEHPLWPQLITLEGEVCLLSFFSSQEKKTSHALSDTLIYHPEEQTLLFTGNKKVLFWQEGMSLSASEVLIRKDETIEGRGNVHFHFDLEEQNYIDQIFRQYL